MSMSLLYLFRGRVIPRLNIWLTLLRWLETELGQGKYGEHAMTMTVGLPSL
jgi:hypothetical protein